MATANDIIVRALTRIGIRASETSLQADEIQDGIDLLNDMLIGWEEAGYNLGFSPVAGASDEVRIPRGAKGAVIDHLALRMAPEYSRPVSQALAGSAVLSFNNMIAATINLSDVDMPATLPLGSGNHCDDGDDRRFFTQSDEVNF